jgi:hypothetical protein
MVCAACTISGPLVYHLIRWNVGKCIFQLPRSPRASRVQGVGEGVPVKTDEGVDPERKTWDKSSRPHSLPPSLGAL